MNAQLKPNQQAAQDVKVANRRSDVFWINREHGREELQDEIAEHVQCFLDEILKAYQADDDLEIGRIVGNCIAIVGLRIYTKTLAEQMRDDLMPSFRSEVTP